MANSYFLSVVLGLILGMNHFGRVKLFKRNAQLGALMWSNFHFLWQSLLIILLYQSVLIRIMPPGTGNEFLLIFVAGAAYLYGLLDKQNPFLPVAIILLCCYVIENPPVSALSLKIYHGCYIGGGAVLLNLLVLGLHEKLIFSNVPKSFSGTPILFVLGAIVAMVLWGLQTGL